MKDRAYLRLRVTPRSSRAAIEAYEHGVLGVRVTAPPTDGQANKAVVELLSKWLVVPKTTVRIVAGAAGRSKTISISSLTQAELDKRLAETQGK